MRSRVPPDCAYWSSPKVPQPAPPMEFPKIEWPSFGFEMPEMPAPYDPEAADARRRRDEEIKKQRAIESRRHGYRSTLLTGGEGVTETPDLNKPALTGKK